MRLVIDYDTNMGIQVKKLANKIKKTVAETEHPLFDDADIQYNDKLNFDVTITISEDSKTIEVLMIANELSKILKRPNKLKKDHHLSNSGLRLESFSGSLNDLMGSIHHCPTSPVAGSRACVSGKEALVGGGEASSPKKEKENTSPQLTHQKAKLARPHAYTQIVDKGESISATFNLPTIAAYDIEFTNEFIAELTKNMVVVHGYDVNMNTIIMKEDLDSI